MRRRPMPFGKDRIDRAALRKDAVRIAAVVDPNVIAEYAPIGGSCLR